MKRATVNYHDVGECKLFMPISLYCAATSLWVAMNTSMQVHHLFTEGWPQSFGRVLFNTDHGYSAVSTQKGSLPAFFIYWRPFMDHPGYVACDPGDDKLSNLFSVLRPISVIS